MPTTANSTDQTTEPKHLSNQQDSSNKPPQPKKPVSLPMAILMTLAIVVFIRESAVLICQALGYPSAGNIVGLLTLFVLLIAWRFTFGLPEWITPASNTLLVDSGFAFLPISAGAGLLMFGLGDELWGIVITMLVSTILPLWGLAKLSNYWLGSKVSDNADSDTNAHSSTNNPR